MNSTAPPTHLPMVSVIVPVYRNRRGLKRCLAALANQSYPRERFEVIVVDNGARFGPGRYVSLVARHPGFRLIRESRRGSYAARNAGIRAARGTVLAFTDSDCLPAPDWLEEGVRGLLAHPGCGLLGGRIELYHRSLRSPRPTERYDELFLGFPQARFLAQGRYAATANLFTTRQILDAVGLFDDRLVSAGDVEWGRRVSGKGYALAYRAEAIVRHPSRRGLFALLRKVRRTVGGAFQLAPPRTFRETLELAGGELKRTDRVLGRAREAGALDRGFSLLVRTVQLVRALERIRLFWGGAPLRA